MIKQNSAPPSTSAPIDRDTVLGAWDALPRGLSEILCDFHQKCELVIRNGGRENWDLITRPRE
jgi:hypothetical protein